MNPKEVLRQLGLGLGRVGYQAMSAGVAKVLEEADKFTEEVGARIKRGARAANRMAQGQPYQPEDTYGTRRR